VRGSLFSTAAASGDRPRQGRYNSPTWSSPSELGIEALFFAGEDGWDGLVTITG
jgi:hypothetical protein